MDVDLPQLLGERGNDLEQIADEPVVRDLEDRRQGSLLIATMQRDDDMPARCWIAPEIPTAT